METWELEAMNLVRSRVNGQVCKKGIDPLAVCLGDIVRYRQGIMRTILCELFILRTLTNDCFQGASNYDMHTGYCFFFDVMH